MSTTASQIAADVVRTLKREDAYELLPEIVNELQKELYRNTDITVVSAVRLSESDQSALEKRLAERWGDHQVLHTVDPSLLSGFLIKFQDTVIDLTGKQALADFKQELS
jgi:F0F1-type ATP synthase delta subunit